MKKTKMLKKNYEFKNVMKKGKSYYAKNIIAIIQKNNTQYNYLGLAISTKICKAVGRNKIKRLIREGYYSLENEILTGYNIVFLWNQKSNPYEIAYKEIKKDIETIIYKAKIIEI